MSGPTFSFYTRHQRPVGVRKCPRSHNRLNPLLLISGSSAFFTMRTVLTPTNTSHTPPLDCQNTTLSQELGLRGLGKVMLPSPSLPFPVASKSDPAA